MQRIEWVTSSTERVVSFDGGARPMNPSTLVYMETQDRQKQKYNCAHHHISHIDFDEEINALILWCKQ